MAKRGLFVLLGALLAIVAQPVGAQNVLHHQSTLVVHPSQTYGPAPLCPVGGDLLSGNGSFTGASVATGVSAVGFSCLRYPQGTIGNCLHSSTNTCGSGGCALNQGAANTDAAYATLLGSRVGHVILNMASDTTCTTANSTSDSVALATDIVAQGCTQCASGWYTMDNEDYNNGVVNSGCGAGQDGTCYATTFATWCTALQTALPGAHCGLDADPQQSGPHGSVWDANVMNGQTFQFADGHFYHTNSPNETDADSLTAPQLDFTAQFMPQFKSDVAASGSPSAKLFVGEYGIIPSNYSVEQQGIVQALFNAEMVGECAQDGVYVCEFHAATSNCAAPVTGGGLNNLYGQWIPFSGAQSVSLGLISSQCTVGLNQPTAGTVLAPGAGLQVASNFTQSGETILKGTLTDSSGNLAVYQSTFGAGYSILAINRSQFVAQTLQVSITGHASGSGGNIVQYCKSDFDLTNNAVPVWNGPRTTTLGAWTTNFSVVVGPWCVLSVQTG